jgi:hypothetical protein
MENIEIVLLCVVVALIAIGLVCVAIEIFHKIFK